jgi:hypothetical protein
LKPLIIGKHKKPRCFKGISHQDIEIHYRNNGSAWMTTAIFLEWLRQINHIMIEQHQTILLVLDNAPSHGSLDLSNVKFCFLPPNTTSIIQPLDQGIIQNFKTHYQRLFLMFLLSNNDAEISVLLRSILVLDAMNWTILAWNSVECSTICRCFVKSGLITDHIPNIEATSENEDLQAIDLLLREAQLVNSLGTVTWNEYLKIDECLTESTTEDIFSQTVCELMDKNSTPVEEIESTNAECTAGTSELKMALAKIREAKLLLSSNFPLLTREIYGLEAKLSSIYVSRSTVQTKINSYFQSK